MTIEITDSSFKTEVADSTMPVLVDFWAPWCGPCKMVAPVLDELAREYEGKLKIVKLNVDQNQQVAAQFGISSIPHPDHVQERKRSRQNDRIPVEGRAQENDCRVTLAGC